MPIELVKAQVEIEMNANNKFLLSSGLGIDIVWDGDIDSYFFHQNDVELNGKNVLLTTMYRFDGRGYWIVTYTHTLPLKKIPDYMGS